MQRGWTLEIRERGVANSQCDDLYWIVPQSGRYRSTAELKEAELTEARVQTGRAHQLLRISGHTHACTDLIFLAAPRLHHARVLSAHNLSVRDLHVHAHKLRHGRGRAAELAIAPLAVVVAHDGARV
eukprot:4665376-Prymnesium_polylepis.1